MPSLPLRRNVSSNDDDSDSDDDYDDFRNTLDFTTSLVVLGFKKYRSHEDMTYEMSSHFISWGLIRMEGRSGIQYIEKSCVTSLGLYVLPEGCQMFTTSMFLCHNYVVCVSSRMPLYRIGWYFFGRKERKIRFLTTSVFRSYVIISYQPKLFFVWFFSGWKHIRRGDISDIQAWAIRKHKDIRKQQTFRYKTNESRRHEK